MSVCPAAASPALDRGEPSVSRRILYGTSWAVLGNGLGQGLILVAHVVTARFLGRGAYGELGAIISTTVTFAAFASLGLGLAATKSIAQYWRTDPGAAARVVRLSSASVAVASLLAAGLLAASAGWLASSALAAPHLRPLLQLAALTVVLSGINAVQSGTLNGFECFDKSALLNVVRGLLSVPALVAGAAWAGVTGAVLGLVAVAAATCVLGRFLVRSALRRRHMPRATLVESWRKERNLLWNFSLPALFTAIVATAGVWTLNAIIVNGQDGYARLGMLTAIRNWIGVMTFLPVALAGGAIPVMSASQNASDEDARRHSFLSPHRITQAMVWSIAIVLMAAAAPLLAAYGPGFPAARTAFLWMVGGTATGYVGYACGLLTQARGLMWFALAQQVVFVAASSLVTIVALPRYGLVAAGYGTTVGSAVLLVWLLAYLVARHRFPRRTAFSIARGATAMLAATTFFAAAPETLVRLAGPLGAALALGYAAVTLRHVLAERFEARSA